jgi:hypothetical protein
VHLVFTRGTTSSTPLPWRIRCKPGQGVDPVAQFNAEMSGLPQTPTGRSRPGWFYFLLNWNLILVAKLINKQNLRKPP